MIPPGPIPPVAFLIPCPGATAAAGSAGVLAGTAAGLLGHIQNDAVLQNVVLPLLAPTTGPSASSSAETSAAAEASAAAAAAGAAAGGATSPEASARLRFSRHSGFRIAGDATSLKTPAFDLNEGTGMGNVAWTAPGKVLGGSLQISGFAGASTMTVAFKPSVDATTGSGSRSRADGEMALGGSSLLWSSNGTYAIATAAGGLGRTTTTDASGDPASGVYRTTYGTQAWLGNVAAGSSMPLFDLSPGTKLHMDVRAALAYARQDGEAFADRQGNRLVPAFEGWSGAVALMLFAQMKIDNDTVLRPYAQTIVRQLFTYDNEVRTTLAATGETARVNFQQDRTYLEAEVGFYYLLPSSNITFGLGANGRISGDDQVIGARISASFKFN